MAPYFSGITFKPYCCIAISDEITGNQAERDVEAKSSHILESTHG
jgi:hypothetical protein